MDERLQFVARRLAGEPMAELCREFGISRKTGYKIFDRYQQCGLQGLTDRSRRPYRYVNQLPFQVENYILQVKHEHPSWGARKIRERLIRRFSGVPIPVKNNAQGGTQYATSAAYNTASQLTGFSYANGVTASYGYSSDRLQLTSLAYAQGGGNLLSLSYGYSQSGTNNGQIASITDNVASGRTVNYTYDSLHRLSTAVSTGSTPDPQWGLSWSYDRYGNRTAQNRTHGSVVPTNSVNIDTSTNRITSMNGFTFYYDSNGNLTQDDLYKYKYDAENRMVELRLLNNTLVATYAFDGNSLRVIKVVGADRTWFIYAGTQLVSEYDDAASANYSAGTQAGSAPSEATSTLLYQHADHLTTRLTTENSTDTANLQRHYPYGETLQASGTANGSVLRKFTTYLKDWESDSGKLNYSVFRQHSGRIARFNTADPKHGGSSNPQRLNRYAYVGGNPITRQDARGLDWEEGSDSDGKMCGTGPCEKPIMEGDDIFTILGEFGGVSGAGFNGGGVVFNNCAPNFSTGPAVTFTPTVGGALPGVPGLPSFGCALPTPTTPQCFAKLRYRNRHLFWHVKGSSEEGIISGDVFRSRPCLNVYYTAGKKSSINEDSDTSGREFWHSEESSGNCGRVANMVHVAKNFPNNKVIYGLNGPSSNSVAFCMMMVAPFNVDPEPSVWTFPGWRFQIRAGGCP